jgi:hypothetical protein
MSQRKKKLAMRLQEEPFIFYEDDIEKREYRIKNARVKEENKEKLRENIIKEFKDPKYKQHEYYTKVVKYIFYYLVKRNLKSTI